MSSSSTVPHYNPPRTVFILKEVSPQGEAGTQWEQTLNGWKLTNRSAPPRRVLSPHNPEQSMPPDSEEMQQLGETTNAQSSSTMRGVLDASKSPLVRRH